jgi:lycopene elongase/hydratase (dihydrobisanhydrobacterioruberin-forming)
MNLRTIIRISRPRFYLYTAGPVLLGAVFADPLAFLTLPLLYAFVWFLIPANVFLYGVNDLADRDTDRYNPKKGTKEHLLRDRERRSLTLAILLSLALFAPLALISSWAALMFFVAFIVLGAAYSLPPRLKARPILDAASNVLYAMPGLGAYALASGQLPSVFAMLAAFAWTAAMHWMSAIPDIEADRAAGLSTSASLFGRRASLIVVSFLWALCLLFASLAGLPLVVVLIGLVYPIIPLTLLTAPSDAIERAYWRYPWINAIAGFVLFVSAMVF